MARKSKAQKEAEAAAAAEETKVEAQAEEAPEPQVEDETPEETEDDVEGQPDTCCDRHPECDADKCRCFSKCLASVCECDGERGKSYSE